MAVAFNPSNLGSVVGFEVEGATPVHRISLGVAYETSWVSGSLDATWRDAKGAVRDSINEYFVAGWNGIVGAVGQFVGGDSGAQEALRLAGASELPTPPQYNQGGLSKLLSDERTNLITEAAQMPLDRLIQPLGMVTGISLTFEDPVNVVGITVEAGANQQLYRGAISGVSFGGACNANVQSHGLEPLLEYFYHHRVTNVDKNLTRTTLKVGSTVLKGWVTGFTAQPLNLDYQIWSWRVHLAISPDYVPSFNRFSSASTRGLARRTVNFLDSVNPLNAPTNALKELGKAALDYATGSG